MSPWLSWAKALVLKSMTTPKATNPTTDRRSR
jgi:hypothetical protein